VAGVDDWAWRKGSNYGTIIVDLELPRDNQDENLAANRMRIVVGCGGGGRSL
jgi:hypothetical protein